MGISVVIANEKIKITVAIDISEGGGGAQSIIRDPEGVVTTFLCESRSGGIWRGGIAKEEGVAVYITNEQIEITVAIDVGKGRSGVVANIWNSKGIFITFLGVSRR